MKLLKSYYIQLIFFVIVIVFCSGLLYLNKYFPSEIKIPLIGILIGLIFFISIMVMCMLFTNMEEKYIKIINIPIEDFNIEERKNGFVVTFDNCSYIVPLKYKNYIEKDSIKAKIYYDRKKEISRFRLCLPHLTQ
jgi:hypothetical protein